MNKAETILALQTTHDQLVTAIARVPADMMTQPGVTGQWSIKDILMHVVFWEQIMLSRLKSAVQHQPAPSYSIPAGETVQQTVDRLNDENYQANRDRPLSDIRQDFDRSFQQVMDAAQALSDSDFTESSEIAKALRRPVSADFAVDTFDHYPEHTQAILNWLNRRGGEVF